MRPPNFDISQGGLMGRKLLALLLLLFATPAFAAKYTGTTSGLGMLYTPIPTGPGHYQLSFQLDQAPPFQLTIFHQMHFNEYFPDGTYLGGDDADAYDDHDYYSSPTHEGTVQWEIEQPYTVYNSFGRTDYYFNGVTAYFDFWDDPALTIHYTVTVTAVPGIASFAAVPEPGEWALLIAGIGLGGAAVRRRRRAGSGLLPAACA